MPEQSITTVICSSVMGSHERVSVHQYPQPL